MKFDSCVGSANAVLVWFGSTFVDLANAHDQLRYIAYPSMYAACLEYSRHSHCFFFEDSRLSLHSGFLLSKLAFSSSVK